MNIKGYIFTLLMFLSFNHAHAEWRDANSLNLDSYEEIDKEFIISKFSTKECLEIVAVDGELNEFVVLRPNNNNVDYQVVIRNSSVNKDSSLFLQLLDHRGFKVKEVFISNLDADYTGILRGSFNIKPDEFYKFKKFYLAYRSK